MTPVLVVLEVDLRRLVVQEHQQELLNRFEVVAGLPNVPGIAHHQVEEQALRKVDPRVEPRKDINLQVLTEGEEGTALGEALVQVQEKSEKVAEVLIVVKMRTLVTSVPDGKESEAALQALLECTFDALTLLDSDQNFQLPPQTLLLAIRLVWQTQQ